MINKIRKTIILLLERLILLLEPEAENRIIIKHQESKNVKEKIEFRGTTQFISVDDPRPKHGREKLQEQLHLGNCCPKHGCEYKLNDCPIESKKEIPYFPLNNSCHKCYN